ncbi:MAG: GNAT family N-acetyltransferase [Blastocatellia bacterium]|nr:GNAT family N-acetyltransferase [Blastocatellia bacterium]
MELDAFKIELATDKDVGLILAFIKELAHEESLSSQVTTDEGNLLHYLFGEQAQAEVIIGYYDSRPVSYALFFPDFSSFAGQPGIHLEDLYVRPEMRGKGIGLRMLKHLARLAMERGCGRVQWCSLKKNKSAARFYKGLGAVPLNEFLIFRLSGEVFESLVAD